MVNNVSQVPSTPAYRTAASTLTCLYTAVSLGTVLALAILSSTAPHLAPREAWGHAVIVAVFAVLLPVRLRDARRGGLRALLAVRVISSVLFAVNAVEAALPAFPIWMRMEMAATAALMLLLLSVLVRGSRPRP